MAALEVLQNSAEDSMEEDAHIYSLQLRRNKQVSKRPKNNCFKKQFA